MTQKEAAARWRSKYDIRRIAIDLNGELLDQIEEAVNNADQSRSAWVVDAIKHALGTPISNTSDQLDRIEKRLSAIEKRLNAGTTEKPNA